MTDKKRTVSIRMLIKPRAWWWVWYWPHDRYVEHDLHSQDSVDWTCNEKTRAGDFALLYVLRPTSSLIGVLQATSDAKRDSSAKEFTIHPWGCEGVVLRMFKQPASLSELRADRWLNKNWGLIRANFQAAHGKSPVVKEAILSRLIRHIPDLEPYVAQGRQGPSPRACSISPSAARQ